MMTMSKLFVVVALVSCLAQCGVSWTGFYTPEYTQYSVAEQTISVVFTLEAPFQIVQQAPLSLSTVLDTSGSMQGSAIALLKATTQVLALELAEAGGLHDVGLVAYDSSVEELSSLVPATTSNAELLSFIVNSIEASGRTFLSAGLNLGVSQQATAPFGKVKSVYLFSDGFPNVGPTTIPEILSAVDNILASTDDYISISTFGMGNRIDYALLSAIAERGGGDAYVIRRPQDIPVAFGKALAGLTTIVGTEIEVIFTTFPGCRIKSVTTGGVYTQSSLTVTYDNLFAGESRDILFEVELGVAPVGFEKCLQTEYYYVDAVTRERITGGSFILEVERVFTVPTFLFPAPRVEEDRLKFLTADACLLAKQKILAGDKQGALEALFSAKSAVENSPVEDSTVISALLVDIDVLIVEVEDDEEEEVLKLGSLGSFATTLRKERSVSTMSEEFEIDKTVETEEQKSLATEFVDNVFGFLGIDPNAIPEEDEEDGSSEVSDPDGVEEEEDDAQGSGDGGENIVDEMSEDDGESDGASPGDGTPQLTSRPDPDIEMSDEGPDTIAIAFEAVQDDEDTGDGAASEEDKDSKEEEAEEEEDKDASNTGPQQISNMDDPSRIDPNEDRMDVIDPRPPMRQDLNDVNADASSQMQEEENQQSTRPLSRMRQGGRSNMFTPPAIRSQEEQMTQSPPMRDDQDEEGPAESSSTGQDMQQSGNMMPQKEEEEEQEGDPGFRERPAADQDEPVETANLTAQASSLASSPSPSPFSRPPAPEEP